MGAASQQDRAARGVLFLFPDNLADTLCAEVAAKPRAGSGLEGFGPIVCHTFADCVSKAEPASPLVCLCCPLC